jgi:polar amino acid transport system substrate-binding protein
MRIKSAISILLLTYSLHASAQQLKFAMLQQGESQNISMCVLLEAYQNIGITVTFDAFPTTRSLKLSNSGVYDGETARVLAAQNKYKNLIPITIPTLHMRGTVFTIKHTDFKPNGFASLAPFRVIIPKTVIFFERGTKDLPDVTKGTDFHAPFKMLAAGRGDIVASTYLAGVVSMRELNLNNVVALKPPIMGIPLHHFLNKKHLELVPIITAQMQRMQNSGRIEQIYQQYIAKLTDINIEPDFNNGDPPSVPCPSIPIAIAS